MKKLLSVFLLAFVLVLSACGNEEPDEADVEEKQEDEKEVIEVAINVDPIITDGKVYFIGETNLPDRGILMFTVTGPNDFMAQTKDIILDGEFQTDVFSAKGEPLPAGDYNLSVSLSVPSTQDEEEFIKATGENYEYLAGDLMDESDLGKSMHYETTFKVE